MRRETRPVPFIDFCGTGGNNPQQALFYRTMFRCADYHEVITMTANHELLQLGRRILAEQPFSVLLGMDLNLLADEKAFRAEAHTA
jgi:hypothetical protein